MTEPNTISWDTRIPGAKPIPVVLKEHPEQLPPDGFPVLVAINRAGQIEPELIGQIQSKVSSGSDGIIQAAMFLEEQLGYTCARPECVRAVKEIRNQVSNHSTGDIKIVMPLRQFVFMSEESFQKVMDLPGVETTDEKYRKDLKTRVVDSEIEWPEDYTGGVLDPTADRDGGGGELNVDLPPQNKTESVMRTDGVLTQINSMPSNSTQGKEQNPEYRPVRRGVNRG